MSKETVFPLQEKVTRLEEIEKSFQQNDLDLDKSFALHKEALAIAKEVQDYLKDAEQTLEQIDIASLRKSN
ncbi:MAG TPA: exodeoxyribonuclease VII small subunit [Verrucomicrobiae bacterium]|nr:exodeoxyribonuclease VII small subunit [Verrucomicrobiae bacterium]